MKIKTADLIGDALDWAVCEAENRHLGMEQFSFFAPVEEGQPPNSPSTNWAQGGPIIDRERIWLAECSGAWSARPALNFDRVERPEIWATTALIAAMRCYVVAKLGDEVDIPEELLP